MWRYGIEERPRQFLHDQEREFGSTETAKAKDCVEIRICVDVAKLAKRNGRKEAAIIEEVRSRTVSSGTRTIIGSTLTGTVPTEELRAHAEDVAKSVKGVNQIVNNIKIKIKS